MAEECIFCKIARKEIPAYIIYEDKEIISFLDVNPYVKGHVLIIPKKHTDWIWDMNKDEYLKLKERCFYLAKILREVFDTDWIEEVIAGVGVQHTHVHLLPRKKNDGLGEIPIKPLEPKLSEEEIKEIMEKIKKNLK